MTKDKSLQLFHLILSCLAATCISCTSKAVFPDLSSDHIKAFKSEKIYATNSSAVKTGVHVEKGDFYSLIVTGHVSTSRWDKPIVGYSGSRPERKLGVIIDKRMQIAPPINATLASPVNGEISLVVDDYGFIPEYGYAKYNNKDYKDNSGSFEATVIVWKTKDIDRIVEFFNQFKTINSEDEVGDKLVAQANSLKASLAEAQIASASVDDSQQKNGGKSAALSTKPESSDSQPAEFATTVTYTQPQQTLPNISLTDKMSEAPEDRYAPLMMLLSPREGQITSTSVIQLIGVVEDDTVLKEVEIRVNGKPIALTMNRGIILDSIELNSRYEFNEKIPLAIGPNRVQIRAEDISGRVSEKIVSIQREESIGTVWAVVVGINSYLNLPQLKYAVNDAQAFHDFLLETGLVEPDNVFRILNDQAKLNSLRSVLGTKLKQQAGKGDMVIIYFAGHGATERDANSPDGDGLEKYLLPYDADPADLYASALPMREISYILNRIQSNRLIFIADSCYSGASGGRTVSLGSIRTNLSDNYIDRIAGGKGRVIMTASAANEVSVEDDRLEHGIFTYYLLKGLRGNADYDSDGYVTVDEAYRYVSEEVPKATGQEQHPIKKGSVEGQLVLGIIE